MVTREFGRLMSHFLFASHFCRPASEREGARRTPGGVRPVELPVPVPRVDSLAELNARLTAQCQRDQERTTRGKPGTVATRLVEDRAAMLPIPVKRFEPRRVTEVAADSLSLVRFDTNSYSVPTKYAHRTLTVIGTLEDVRVVFEDRTIARHPRRWEGAVPLRPGPLPWCSWNAKRKGSTSPSRWNTGSCPSAGRVGCRLEAEEADGWGTRGFIRVLRLLEIYSLRQLTDAVESALAIDVIDPDSIGVILDHRLDRPVPVFSLDGRPHLAGVQVAVTDVAAYGVLLAGEGMR